MKMRDKLKLCMRETEKIRTIKKYGKWYRVSEMPKYKPKQRSFVRKPADNDKPKARNNYGTSMFKAYAIALNNKWQWYGTLQLANESVIDFATAYGYINSLISRLRKIRSRTESKSLAYLIIPDYTEQDELQQWFIHIWLLDFPNTEKAFSQDKVVNKKIMYHWIKYEKQNGKSELYRIYDTDYVSNGEYTDTIARQIFDIIKRTATLIPKEMSLYYCSNDVVRDEVIASGTPTLLEIPSTSYSNDFVKSKWFNGKSEKTNLQNALEYIETYREEETKAAEEQPEVTDFDYDFYSYDNFDYEENYDYTDDYFYSSAPADYVPQAEDYNVLK